MHLENFHFVIQPPSLFYHFNNFKFSVFLFFFRSQFYFEIPINSFIESTESTFELPINQAFPFTFNKDFNKELFRQSLR